MAVAARYLAHLVVAGVGERAVQHPAVAVGADVAVDVIDECAGPGLGYRVRAGAAGAVAVVGRRTGAATGRDVGLADDIAGNIIALALLCLPGAAVEAPVGAREPPGFLAHRGSRK